MSRIQLAYQSATARGLLSAESTQLGADTRTPLGSSAGLKIGIDTLFEDPNQPSSAIDYLKNLIYFLPRVGAQHTFFVFVSPRNRAYFQNLETNVKLINCLVSNEHVPLRIAIQQSVLPLRSQQVGLDVLFSPGNVCPLWGSFRRVLKINTLHHYNMPRLVGRTRSLYRRLAFTKSACRADHIIANSAATKTEICKRMGIPGEKISVVSEASYEFYRREPVSQIQTVRARYYLDDDYILFVSNLYPYKNLETLIKAFARFKSHSPTPYRLVIAGRDCSSYQGQLETLAATLNVASAVKFLGFVAPTDLPALYSGARVFVYPSLMETFGKPLVEAMGCGVPIVAADTSSIPEVLGNAGLLVPPQNADNMADAIHAAATNESLRAELVQKGFERVRKFSWQSSAQETLAVIERTARQSA